MTEEELILLAGKIADIQQEYAQGKTTFDSALARVLAASGNLNKEG